MDWWNNPERKCRGTDPNYWLPNIGQLFGKTRIKELRAICEGCPVQADCLKDALKGCRIGFQAGYTARELRRPPLTGQHNQPCGTNAAWLRHHKLGEPKCEPCKQAHRLASKKYPVRNLAVQGFTN